VIVCLIRPCRDGDTVDVLGEGNPHVLVGDQGGLNAEALDGAKQDLSDRPRARIGVDEDFHLGLSDLLEWMGVWRMKIGHRGRRRQVGFGCCEI